MVSLSNISMISQRKFTKVLACRTPAPMRSYWPTWVLPITPKAGLSWRSSIWRGQRLHVCRSEGFSPHGVSSSLGAMGQRPGGREENSVVVARPPCATPPPFPSGVHSIVADFHQESTIFVDVHQDSIMFVDFHQECIIFTDVHQESILFADVHHESIIFSRCPPRVHYLSPISTKSPLFSHMLIMSCFFRGCPSRVHYVSQMSIRSPLFCLFVSIKSPLGFADFHKDSVVFADVQQDSVMFRRFPSGLHYFLWISIMSPLFVADIHHESIIFSRMSIRSP